MAALRIVGEIGGDGSGWERTLNKAKSQAHQFGSTAIAPLKNMIAGVFTVGAISQLVRGTVQWADQLRDVADNLGVSVEWLQKMQNGAKLVGADIGDIEKTILELNRSREDAFRNPTGKNAQAMGRLGMTGADISGLSTQAFFDKMVKAFSQGASTQAANDLIEVGGRSARGLIAAFHNQFQSDMPILAEELIDQLADIDDEFTSLGQQLKVQLAPAIVEVAKVLVEAINQLKQGIAFIGGAFSQTSLTDYIKMVLTGGILNPANREKMQEMFNSGGAAMADAESEQKKEKERIDAAKEEAKKNRKDREKSAPQFEDIDAAKGKKGRESGDALVKVGNFLGATGGVVNAIAEKQFDVQQKQLAEQKKQRELLKAMLEELKRRVNDRLTLSIPSS